MQRVQQQQNMNWRFCVKRWITNITLLFVLSAIFLWLVFYRKKHIMYIFFIHIPLKICKNPEYTDFVERNKDGHPFFHCLKSMLIYLVHFAITYSCTRHKFSTRHMHLQKDNKTCYCRVWRFHSFLKLHYRNPAIKLQKHYFTANHALMGKSHQFKYIYM